MGPPGVEMYFLFKKIGTFQPAMLVYQRVIFFFLKDAYYTSGMFPEIGGKPPKWMVKIMVPTL